MSAGGGKTGAAPQHLLEQAHALILQDRAKEALEQLQKLTARFPRDLGALSLAGMAAQTLGNFDQAEYYARSVLALLPRDSDAMTNVAITMFNNPKGTRKKREEALVLLRKAIEINPANHNARVGIANILMEQNQPAQALAVCEAGRAIEPHDQLTATHAKALLQLARVEEGVALLEDAMRRWPNEPIFHLSACVQTHTQDGATPRLAATRHASYARLMMDALSRQPAVQPPVRVPTPADASRPLRVGFFSPDLRRHSVAFFVRPLMERLDAKDFTLFGYHNNIVEDDFTALLRAGCERTGGSLRVIFADSDAQLTQRARSDGLDIAIDLAGLTSGHRLGVFARRPAPVTITYCGYPDTTGLPAVDYRIVDSNTDPREEDVPAHLRAAPGWLPFDQRCSESLLRLDPCFLCYAPPPKAPQPSRSERGAGEVVFGSFNAARKLTARTAELWARVLRAVPGSRLTLKATDFADPLIAAHVRGVFAKAGVRDGDLTILPPTASVEEHLAQYAHVDIALETLPYQGTTTTCEALFMGVPVLTLEGVMHVSRVGVSLLRAAGLPALVARDEDHYVELAGKLARDRAALGVPDRDALRAQMLASALCDQGAFVERFARALREVWVARCNQQRA